MTLRSKVNLKSKFQLLSTLQPLRENDGNVKQNKK